MSETAIRAEIVSVLGGITDIGTVIGRRRLARNQKEMQSIFGWKKSGKDYLRGWMVTRESTSEERITSGSGGTNAREHVYVIDGYFGFTDPDTDADASETALQAMVETICDTFRPLENLNGKASKIGPVQVEAVDHRIFGDFLTNHVELRLTVRERVAR